MSLFGGVSDLGKKIVDTGKNIASSDIVKTALTLNPVTGPYMIGKNILDSRSARRQQIHADEEAAREAAQEAQAIGQEELGKYATGELTQGQKDTIKQQTDVQKAQLRQAMASGGISDSSMRTTEEANIRGYGAGLADKFAQEHWDAAMKVMGLSDSAMNTLHQMNVNNMQENIQLYSGLMNLIGTGVGAWAGGAFDSAPAYQEMSAGEGTQILPSGYVVNVW